MPLISSLCRALLPGAAALVVLSPVAAQADDGDVPKPSLTLELGATWQLRNTVQIPNEPPNTRFGLDELTGEGPYPAGRVMLDWPLGGKHHLRFIIAPLGIEETGTSSEPIVFQDTTFAAGEVRATYRFDSYRATYRYVFHDSANWTWSGGATLNVRDAEIGLKQGDLRRTKSNTGLVPLLALYGEWRFAPGWTGVFDFEGLGAPQGRAIDAALKIGYDVSPRVNLAAGYRFLDGGADNDELYTFARFDSVLMSLTWRFR